jgi:hypothetical protein
VNLPRKKYENTFLPNIFCTFAASKGKPMTGFCRPPQMFLPPATIVFGGRRDYFWRAP